jgi:2-methylcitrate dehydratase
MVAVPLIHGRLTAADYEDTIAKDPRIDKLRSKMEVRENGKYTKDYYDPAKRYIGNAIQVFFKGGSKTDRIEVEFPIGHRKRRAEGIPVLVNKFEKAIAGSLSARQCAAINALCGDQKKLEAAPVTDFMALWTV